MRTVLALALGLVAGLSYANWQNLTLATGQTRERLAEKLTAPHLAEQTVEQIDDTFGKKGLVTAKEYKVPGTGIDSILVYFEKGKCWSVTYELEPSVNLSTTWWQDAVRTVGLDPTKGKMDSDESDDSSTTIREYPGLKGRLRIDQSLDKDAHQYIVTVDWEVHEGDE